MKGLFFLIYIFIEVMVTLSFAHAIGVFYTFLEIVLSALVGVAILFSTPFKFQESIQKIKMNRLSLSTFSLASTIRILGAFLIIFPGFFADMVGIILLIISSILLIGNKISAKNGAKEINEEDVIDVEIIDANSDKR